MITAYANPETQLEFKLFSAPTKFVFKVEYW